jgi:hypothetical protein
MRCCRCKGMMIHEKFYGQGDDYWGWRCILCGDVLDPVVMGNRLVQRQQNFMFRNPQGRKGNIDTLTADG